MIMKDVKRPLQHQKDQFLDIKSTGSHSGDTTVNYREKEACVVPRDAERTSTDSLESYLQRSDRDGVSKINTEGN